MEWSTSIAEQVLEVEGQVRIYNEEKSTWTGVRTQVEMRSRTKHNERRWQDFNNDHIKERSRTFFADQLQTCTQVDSDFNCTVSSASVGGYASAVHELRCAKLRLRAEKHCTLPRRKGRHCHRFPRVRAHTDMSSLTFGVLCL